MKNNEISALVGEIAEKLGKSSLRFATAESCTGGWIAKSVTDLAGVSSVFLGGIVSYANEIKEKLLFVKPETLNGFGAVSEQTVAEMALGAIKATDADFSVAVTGIAGPSGATPDKPLGLVYIACAGKSGSVSVEKHIFDGNRSKVRQSTVLSALSMLDKFIG